MLQEVEEIINRFPVRKTKKQKQAFRQAVTELLQGAGWPVQVESGRNIFACHNVVAGDAPSARYLFTAHYDTPPVLPVPNIITPKNMGLYLLYQLLLMGAILLMSIVVASAAAFASGGSAAVMVLSSYLFWFLLLWVVLNGPANQTNRNDNTSGVATVLQAALTLPPQLRGQAAFVLFDNEEKGLMGAGLYRRLHKEAQAQTMYNFDCVGEGDHILFVPARGLREDTAFHAATNAAFAPAGGKTVEVARKGAFYPSDQAGYARGVGVAALCRRGNVYYISKIHTRKDTCLDSANVDFLAGGITALLAADASAPAPPQPAAT